MIGTYPEINATIEGVIDEFAFYNYKWTEAELIGSMTHNHLTRTRMDSVTRMKCLYGKPTI